MRASHLRRLAQELLSNLEWIDRHVAARHLKDAESLMFRLADMEKALLKMIGAPLREPKVTREDD
jgi:hypothetical protein